jgi:hypothetical protein
MTEKKLSTHQRQCRNDVSDTKVKIKTSSCSCLHVFGEAAFAVRLIAYGLVLVKLSFRFANISSCCSLARICTPYKLSENIATLLNYAYGFPSFLSMRNTHILYSPFTLPKARSSMLPQKSLSSLFSVHLDKNPLLEVSSLFISNCEYVCLYNCSPTSPPPFPCRSVR